MRKLILITCLLGTTFLSNAQISKNYKLTVVAEGNFGTPNGDLFHVIRENETRVVNGPLYQLGNNTSMGVDVLQDFDYWQTKAVICGKGTHPMKLAIVNYPNMDTLFTVNSGLGAGLQRCGMVSDNKAYIVGANSSVVKCVNINTQTINDVTNTGGHLSSGIHSMIGYNNTMYVANGSKVVTIDTLTNATTGAILTGLKSINTMVKDTVNNCLWVLGIGNVTNLSAIVKINVNNNNQIDSPIVLTGFTNAKHLRVGPNKLYFVSGSGFFIYDLSTTTVPTSPVYTSNFTGFSAMYDRSFTVDPISGDFAYTTAGGFTPPGLFEIVDGTTFSRIDSGAITGAAIPNKLYLHTWEGTSSLAWDTTTLATIYAECDVTLSAPTANYGSAIITGTTDQLNFNTQGTFTVEWKYVSGNDSIHQSQLVVIADTTAPVPDSLQLPELAVNCPYTLIAPTATDNCEGSITATTDSLTLNTAGNYTIIWSYTDSLGNVSTQEQIVVVSCDSSTSINQKNQLNASIYPNPATDNININVTTQDQYQIVFTNTLGQTVYNKTHNGSTFLINTSNWTKGIYMLHIKNKHAANYTQKIIIK